jgi:hypothetical protein
VPMMCVLDEKASVILRSLQRRIRLRVFLAGEGQKQILRLRLRMTLKNSLGRSINDT